ncbi:hypothetical protein AB3S75_015851 [Citrus x aurantiifolia]
MDAQALIKLCKSLSIDEDVKDAVTLDGDLHKNGEKMISFCLAGRVLTTKEVNKEAFKNMVQQSWRVLHEVIVESMGSNTFIFKFSSEADKQRILSTGPWHCNKALVVLTEVTGLGEITKQDFSQSPFWIQIHNVPLMCMNNEMARIIGSKIGTVLEVDPNRTSECLGKFLRIRIMLDITKPLKK